MSCPFPASESLLCYFVVFLARQGLEPSTIKSYLAAVRHVQISEGLPDIRQSALPRLQLVQTGIRREHSFRGSPQAVRLPITLEVLRGLHTSWSTTPRLFNDIMLWAAASSCFFGFFRAGEVTVLSDSSFDAATHLAWGDVTSNVT